MRLIIAIVLSIVVSCMLAVATYAQTDTYYMFVEAQHYAGYMVKGDRSDTKITIAPDSAIAIARVVTFGSVTMNNNNPQGLKVYVCSITPCYIDVTLYTKNPASPTANTGINQVTGIAKQPNIQIYDTSRQNAYVNSFIPIQITMQSFYNTPIVKYVFLSIVAVYVTMQVIAPTLMNSFIKFIGIGVQDTTEGALAGLGYEPGDEYEKDPE